MSSRIDLSILLAVACLSIGLVSIGQHQNYRKISPLKQAILAQINVEALVDGDPPFGDIGGNIVIDSSAPYPGIELFSAGIIGFDDGDRNVFTLACIEGELFRMSGFSSVDILAASERLRLNVTDSISALGASRKLAHLADVNGGQRLVFPSIDKMVRTTDTIISLGWRSLLPKRSMDFAMTAPDGGFYTRVTILSASIESTWSETVFAFDFSPSGRLQGWGMSDPTYVSLPN